MAELGRAQPKMRLREKKAIYSKDLQKVQQLAGIGGNNKSRQYKITLEINEGPTLLVSANLLDHMISKSPLFKYKDAAELIVNNDSDSICPRR